MTGAVIITAFALLLSVIAVAVFYRGLRNYSSGNLMGRGCRN